MGEAEPVGFLSIINRWWQRWKAVVFAIIWIRLSDVLLNLYWIFPAYPDEVALALVFLLPMYGMFGGIVVKGYWDNRNFLDPKPIDTLYSGGNLSWSRMEYPKSLLEAMPIKKVSKEEARRLKEKMEFNPTYLYADQVKLQPDEIGCDGENRYTQEVGDSCEDEEINAH